MKKLLLMLLLAIAAIGIYLYCYRYEEIEVADVSRPQTLTLVAKDKYVVGLEAYVEGYLDDTAKIQNQFIGKGAVKTTLRSGDCYVDTVRISFQPYKAESGNLTVKYRFSTY